jgi:hypothetical protein
MKPVKRLKTRVSLVRNSKAHAALGRVTMYDSIYIKNLPSGAAAYAGYTQGDWPTWSALVAAKEHSGADLLSVDPFGTSPLAHCLDVEPGDAGNATVLPWFRRMKANGVPVPVIYTSASNVQAVVNLLMEEGKYTRSEFLVWAAHYTYSAHICAPAVCGYAAADGTQWSDEGPGGSDVSSLASYFFPWTLGTAPAPTPPSPPKPPPGPQPYPAPKSVDIDHTKAALTWPAVVVDGKAVVSYTVQVEQLNGVVVSETQVDTNSIVLTGLTAGWQYRALVWPNGSPVAPPHTTFEFTA